MSQPPKVLEQPPPVVLTGEQRLGLGILKQAERELKALHLKITKRADQVRAVLDGREVPLDAARDLDRLMSDHAKLFTWFTSGAQFRAICKAVDKDPNGKLDDVAEWLRFEWPGGLARNAVRRYVDTHARAVRRRRVQQGGQAPRGDVPEDRGPGEGGVPRQDPARPRRARGVPGAEAPGGGTEEAPAVVAPQAPRVRLPGWLDGHAAGGAGFLRGVAR